jgi:hypothetical protein
MEQPQIPPDMNSFEQFLLRYGIHIGFMISGFFGALLLVSRDSAQKISTTIASILAGTACANYLTPAVMTLLPESVQLNGKYAVAFTMGFLGLKGLELILNKLFKVKVNVDVEMKKSPKTKTKKTKKTKTKKTTKGKKSPKTKTKNTKTKKRRS